MIRRLEEFERMAKLQETEEAPEVSKGALQVVQACQTLGLVPVPADGSVLLEGDPSSYIDTLGRQCVAQEQLTLGTPEDTIQLIMEQILNELDSYKEQQSRTSSGSSVDSLNDPAEATCTSRKTLGECPTDECIALTHDDGYDEAHAAADDPNTIDDPVLAAGHSNEK